MVRVDGTREIFENSHLVFHSTEAQEVPPVEKNTAATEDGKQNFSNSSRPCSMGGEHCGFSTNIIKQRKVSYKKTV